MKRYYFTFAKTHKCIALSSRSIQLFADTIERYEVKINPEVPMDKIIAKLENYYTANDNLYTYVCIGAIPLED